MNITIRTRLLRLERKAEIDCRGRMKPTYEVFEEMQVSEDDSKLLNAIVERGEPTTPQERAALERLGAEYRTGIQFRRPGAAIASDNVSYR